jgi:hypothetical protein
MNVYHVSQTPLFYSIVKSTTSGQSFQLQISLITLFLLWGGGEGIIEYTVHKCAVSFLKLEPIHFERK